MPTSMDANIRAYGPNTTKPTSKVDSVGCHTRP